MSKHILFDFDGTLIDSAPYVLTCYQQSFAELDIKPAMAITESIIGPPLINTIEMLIAENNPQMVQDLAKKFMTLYDSGVAENTFFYDGVDKVLNTLKQQGHQLYIATNKRYKPTIAILEKLQYLDTFTEIRAVDQLPENNRSKSILIEQILADFNIAIEQAVYIGDKMDDYNAANANDVKFLAAGWGYGDWDKPFTILKSAADIPNAID